MGSLGSLFPYGGAMLDWNWFVETRKGTIMGSSRISALGFLPLMNKADSPQDIFEAGGLYPFPAFGVKLEVLSTDPGDTLLGTGARTVLVSGLDDNYLPVSEVVSLNGTTPIVTSNYYLRVNLFTTTLSGSNRANLGDLTLRVQGTGSTLSIARAGRGFGRACLFTVPAGFTLFVPSLAFSVRDGLGNQPVTCVVSVGQRASTGNVRLTAEFDINGNGPYHHDAVLGIPVGQKTDFFVRCMSVGQNSTSVTAAFEGALLRN